MKRILVIRGGAIGDFILTLPGLKALRESYPKAHIEILGYAHIAALAEKRFYANAVRSIEYGALSRFFARGAELPDDLSSYFADFDLIISYLFDPDRIFQTNLERAGADTIITGPSKLSGNRHASIQLARPIIEDLGLDIQSTAAKVFLSAEDRNKAEVFFENAAEPLVAFHPGSGSEKKNWPVQGWLELSQSLLADEQFAGSLAIVTGEADDAQAAAFGLLKDNPRVLIAHNLPLPALAAVLARTIFVGHDSGVSHLAAAAGAKCILLFGPTDPNIWAPTGAQVKIMRAPDEQMQTFTVSDIERELRSILAGAATSASG